MVFGMSLKETGVKRYPVRVRQRVLQYAVTIFLKEYDPRSVFVCCTFIRFYETSQFLQIVVSHPVDS